MLRDYLKSRTFLTLGLVLAVVMGYLLSKALNRRYQINQEIKGLEAEIAKYEGQNEELAGLIDYFKTPEYQERQARPLLNLQKPGEFAVALPTTPELDQSGEEKSGPALPITNYRLWWDYFFAPPRL